MSARSSRPSRARFLSATTAAALGAAVLLTGTGGQSAQALASQNVSAPLSQVAAPAAEGTSVQTAAYSAAAVKTPVQILAAARAKAGKATSVRVQATIKDTDGNIRFDLRMTKDGKATGSFSTPADGSMKLILVSKKKGFFQPGADMLEKITGGDTQAKEVLAGRWIEFGKGEGLDDIFSVASMKPYTQDVFTLFGPDSDLVKVKGTKVKGYKKTIGLKERGNPGTLLIAADGTNRLAGYQDPQGRMTLTDWNKTVKVKAPANPLKAADFS